mgnify:CR=1 FL=1
MDHISVMDSRVDPDDDGPHSAGLAARLGRGGSYHRPPSASKLLSEIGDHLPDDIATVGQIFDALGNAGLGLTILMMALPSFLPIPGLPTGFVFGTAMAILSFQVMIGSDKLILPEWIRRRGLPRGIVVKGAAAVAPWLRKIEWFLKPRLPVLAGRTAHFVLALPIFVHAVMILLPIPLGNQLPALAVIAFAFGLIERDGIAIIVGAVLSVIALVWNGAIVFFGAELSRLAWQWIQPILAEF